MDTVQLLWASSPYAILLAYAVYACITRKPLELLGPAERQAIEFF